MGFCWRCAAAAEGKAASLQPGTGGGCLLSDKLLGIFVGFANRFSVSLFIIFYHLNDDEAGQLIQVILILKGSLKKV